MATDLMRNMHDLDVIVLCSGDGDLVELARRLLVHVAGVSGHTAGELIAAADGWIPLEEDALVQMRASSPG
jgi:uncharacterized LabA/DUF88 family protein